MIKKVFLICPVRNASPEKKLRMQRYVWDMEHEGYDVYYPAVDTDQNDEIGYRICSDNAKAILEADEVHIFWDKDSKGSLFDLGVAFAYGKPLVLINPEDVDGVEGKSFENMICYWSFKSEEEDETGI